MSEHEGRPVPGLSLPLGEPGLELAVGADEWVAKWLRKAVYDYKVKDINDASDQQDCVNANYHESWAAEKQDASPSKPA